MHTKMNSISQVNLPTSRKLWRLTALAAAMGALLSIVHVDANALALGRITALSALGDPLEASIEIPDINAEELASLKTTLATPEAFRIAGMEYNTALSSTQITLQRRSNGTSYLQIRSDKIVTDPFINLVINANWANGRIVRNYTLLLDPPATKQIEASTVSAPVSVLPQPATVVTPAATVDAASVTRAQTTATQSAGSAPVAMPKASPTGSIAKPNVSTQKPASVNSGQQIKIGNGDTAGKIAANNLPNNVSLEQMLIAMLRGNPQAFIGGNVNRLKAGAILDLPTEAEVFAISENEAKQNVIAQSKDFNSFRRKLAENAPSLTSKSTSRVASGKIEAKVEDQKAAIVTPDKLTLSKGGLSANNKSATATATASKENLDKIAKERQTKEDLARSAELAKNIKDLNTVASNTSAATKAAVTAAPVVVATVPSAPSATNPTPEKVASSAETSQPTVAPVKQQPPVVVPAPVVKTPAAEPTALDFLTDNSAVLPIAGGALALLLFGGLYANNKRKKQAAALAAEEDSWSDSHFEEESFFKETINAPIVENTSDEVEAIEPTLEVIAPIEIAEAPKPKEIDPVVPAVNARAVVDPLTEADVYLGYDRDVPAEEILLDGLKTQPENVAIYTKLLGIYAKRRDAKKFEQTALKAKLFISENDPQWLALSKLGLELEPQNPLYKAAVTEIDDPFAIMSASEFATRTVARLDPLAARSPASVDLDLDFNFASSFPANSVAKVSEPPKKPLVEFPDFSLEPAAKSTVATIAAAVATTAASETFQTPSQTSPAPKAMEFDLANLSLDLNNTESSKAKPLASNDMTGPLETKLALANEFFAIGDKNGAKMLVNEVLASATGSLKTRAEAFLAEIG